MAEDFLADDGGWTFASVPPFEPATGYHETHRIAIETTDNTNTFAFWDSPDYDLTESEPLTDYLMRCYYQINSYIYDGQGHAAHANIPFYVDAPAANQQPAATGLREAQIRQRP